MTDFTETFDNLHTTRGITAQEKNITYRLIFNSTPTTGTQCSTCLTHTPPTEEHIYYTCTHAQPTLQTLKQILQTNYTTQTLNLFQAIFLNTLPKEHKDTKHIKIRLLSIYRIEKTKNTPNRHKK